MKADRIGIEWLTGEGMWGIALFGISPWLVGALLTILLAGFFILGFRFGHRIGKGARGAKPTEPRPVKI